MKTTKQRRLPECDRNNSRSDWYDKGGRVYAVPTNQDAIAERVSAIDLPVHVVNDLSSKGIRKVADFEEEGGRNGCSGFDQ